jgi:hypothetical protein
MFEARFSENLKALETIGVDGRTWRDVLVEEGNDGLRANLLLLRS